MSNVLNCPFKWVRPVRRNGSEDEVIDKEISEDNSSKEKDIHTFSKIVDELEITFTFTNRSFSQFKEKISTKSSIKEIKKMICDRYKIKEDEIEIRFHDNSCVNDTLLIRDITEKITKVSPSGSTQNCLYIFIKRNTKRKVDKIRFKPKGEIIRDPNMNKYELNPVKNPVNLIHQDEKMAKEKVKRKKKVPAFKRIEIPRPFMPSIVETNDTTEKKVISSSFEHEKNTKEVKPCKPGIKKDDLRLPNMKKKIIKPKVNPAEIKDDELHRPRKKVATKSLLPKNREEIEKVVLKFNSSTKTLSDDEDTKKEVKKTRKIPKRIPKPKIEIVRDIEEERKEEKKLPKEKEKPKEKSKEKEKEKSKEKEKEKEKSKEKETEIEIEKESPREKEKHKRRSVSVVKFRPVITPTKVQPDGFDDGRKEVASPMKPQPKETSDFEDREEKVSPKKKASRSDEKKEKEETKSRKRPASVAKFKPKISKINPTEITNDREKSEGKDDDADGEFLRQLKSSAAKVFLSDEDTKSEAMKSKKSPKAIRSFKPKTSPVEEEKRHESKPFSKRHGKSPAMPEIDDESVLDRDKDDDDDADGEFLRILKSSAAKVFLSDEDTKSEAMKSKKSPKAIRSFKPKTSPVEEEKRHESKPFSKRHGKSPAMPEKESDTDDKFLRQLRSSTAKVFRSEDDTRTDEVDASESEKESSATSTDTEEHAHKHLSKEDDSFLMKLKSSLSKAMSDDDDIFNKASRRIFFESSNSDEIWPERSSDSSRGKDDDDDESSKRKPSPKVTSDDDDDAGSDRPSPYSSLKHSSSDDSIGKDDEKKERKEEKDDVDGDEEKASKPPKRRKISHSISHYKPKINYD